MCDRIAVMFNGKIVEIAETEELLSNPIHPYTKRLISSIPITFSSGYGSGVLCKNTGMYFNNSLGEVELNPQGFLGDTKGDRLISNMSPLIIETNDGIREGKVKRTPARGVK